MDIQRLLSLVRRDLRDVGIDTTGEGFEIPPGYIRIFPEQANEYGQAGHLVEERTIQVNGKGKVIVLVAIGEPKQVVRTVTVKEFFPKPSGA